ncbi:MAG: hypothetical protein DHS20C18_10840 [Saprospiraceae bacterium]|nr:MAG: hypothetical protein DHS20C18_10840 [Saprospiraceae bacterium]
MAQKGDSPMVMYVDGEVWYEGVNASPARVYTGTQLGTNGQIILKNKAAVEIIYKEKFVKLNKAGKHDLSKLFGTTTSNMNFVQRFSNFVSNGLDQSASEKQLEKSYLKNQNNAQGNIRGFTDSGLAGIMPIGGNISPETTEFYWPDAGAGVHYEFQIIDSLSEEMIFMALSKATKLSIDLGGLYLKAGKTYYWEAYHVREKAGAGLIQNENSEEKSPRIYFKITPDKQQAILEMLKQEAAYQETASKPQQSLMEAMQLEEAGFLYAADQTYQKAMHQDKENPLLKRNYAAFLARWQQLSKAREVLSDSPDK